MSWRRSKRSREASRRPALYGPSARVEAGQRRDGLAYLILAWAPGSTGCTGSGSRCRSAPSRLRAWRAGSRTPSPRPACPGCHGRSWPACPRWKSGPSPRRTCRPSGQGREVGNLEGGRRRSCALGIGSVAGRAVRKEEASAHAHGLRVDFLLGRGQRDPEQRQPTDQYQSSHRSLLARPRGRIVRLDHPERMQRGAIPRAGSFAGPPP